MSHEEKADGAALEVEDPAPVNFKFQAASAGKESKPAAAPAPPPAADFYAVGVRLIKMSPVWLLTMTGGFLLLTLLLGWLRPAGGDADAATVPNDAKAVNAQQLQPPAVALKPSPASPAPVAVEQPKAEPLKQTAQVAQSAQPAEVANVKPEPAPAAKPAAGQPKAAAPADDAAGKLTVQVGAFNVESQANERISSLRASGFEARSVRVELPGKGTWYRVHVGRYRDREEAAKAAARLREKGVATSMVVPAQ
jgi:cell division septation protein DedD